MRTLSKCLYHVSKFKKKAGLGRERCPRGQMGSLELSWLLTGIALCLPEMPLGSPPVWARRSGRPRTVTKQAQAPLLMARLCGRCAHLYTCTHLYVNSWHRSAAEREAGWNVLGRLVVRDSTGGFKVTLSAKGAWGHGALPHTARKPSCDLQQTGREAGAPSQAVGRQTAVCSDNPGSQTVTPHRSPPEGQDSVNN